jgi:hypothetical protein
MNGLSKIDVDIIYHYGSIKQVFGWFLVFGGYKVGTLLYTLIMVLAPKSQPNSYDLR